MAAPLEQAAWADPSPAAEDPALLAKRVEELEKALEGMKDDAKAKEKAKALLPEVKLGGRTYLDAGFFNQDELNKSVFGDMDNGVGFRNARLTVDGKVVENLDFKTSLDFTGPIFDSNEQHPFLGLGLRFKDVYMTMTELPVVGNVRVGQMKEPHNMEDLMSNRFLTFMDRSMARTAITPDRSIGIMAFNWTENQRATWAIGWYLTDLSLIFPRRDDDDLASSVTARVTALPWYDEATQGRGMMHVGASYSYRDAYNNTRRFFALPETAFGGENAVIVDGGRPTLTNWQLYGLEYLFIWGRLSLQSEYFEAFLNPPGGDLQHIPSAYATVSWFLTGENRTYRRDTAVPDRVKPIENFFLVPTSDHSVGRGMGAWEVAYRADYIDLYDMGPEAGRAFAHTLGLNWYLSPYARLMFNYVHADTDKYYADAGNVNLCQMRAHIDF